jgi:hypothetical protein
MSRALCEAVMRIVPMIGITLGGLLLSSCAGTGHMIGETIPAWAGGLPADAPPRRGTPGYEAYIQQVDGDQAQPANAPPSQAPTATTPSPPKAPSRTDQPVR